MIRRQICSIMFVFIFYVLFFVLSCGNNERAGKTSVGNSDAMGSYQCQLIPSNDIRKIANDGNITGIDGGEIDCDESGISFMKFLFFDADDNPLVRANFECSAREALIEGIPIGTDRKVIITAEDDNGNSILRGEARNITIFPGQITPGGQIEMAKLPPDEPETDTDRDGFKSDVDCNDANSYIYPGATEIPDNEIDENCDGRREKTWYRDSDSDSFGNASMPLMSYIQPTGYVLDDEDCDDGNPIIHPGATENDRSGVDENCDGQDVLVWYRDDDSDGFGNYRMQPMAAEAPPDGYVREGTDCNDGDPTINPDASEIINNNTDENCDGIIKRDLESFTNALGMTFSLIPAGTFMMGSPPDEAGREDTETLHEVTITRPFYMQTTEVTQGQLLEVMGANPSLHYQCGSGCPADTVPWGTAKQFIDILNDSLDDGEYRLPTEAEWEYAARGGTTTAFVNGDILAFDPQNPYECSHDDNLAQVGWYCYNSSDTTHWAAEKAPNAYGLYDMHGNVWEWCEDWYGPNYYQGSPSDDPKGPPSGSMRVLRGGGWGAHALYCRSASRNSYGTTPWLYSYGFRVVLSGDE